MVTFLKSLQGFAGWDHRLCLSNAKRGRHCAAPASVSATQKNSPPVLGCPGEVRPRESQAQGKSGPRKVRPRESQVVMARGTVGAKLCGGGKTTGGPGKQPGRHTV